MSAENKTEVIDIDYQALHELIMRVEHAIENELALDASDMRLLLGAIHTLLEVQSTLDEKNVTLNKLRKLLGMVKSSEKRGYHPSNTEESNNTLTTTNRHNQFIGCRFTAFG